MKRKARIAYIIPGGIGTGKNNIGIPVLEQVIQLMTVDFQVTVFQLYPKNEDYLPKNFQLTEVYSQNPLLRSLKLLVAFRKAHRQQRFEVVHGFWALPCGLLAVLAGKIFRIKSIVSLQGGDAIALRDIRYGQLQRWLPRKLSLWGLKHSNILISPTRYLIANLEKSGFKRPDVKLIPLGVDTSHFTFRHHEFTSTIRFLHVANLHPVKDQVTLLKAFEIISKRISCHLTIIGEGVWESRIRSLARELDLNGKITFLGLLPYASLPEQYHQADILLHTSRSEGHPIVVEEAMSCGVLVCGTEVGLLSDLPDCCVAVPVGDHVSLATETLKLISDAPRMTAMREHAFRWAGAHSMDWTIRNFKDCYPNAAE